MNPEAASSGSCGPLHCCLSLLLGRQYLNGSGTLLSSGDSCDSICGLRSDVHGFVKAAWLIKLEKRSVLLPGRCGPVLHLRALYASCISLALCLT